MPVVRSFDQFILIFPEFRRTVSSEMYTFYSSLAAKTFNDCFSGFLDTDCESEILSLWVAHFLWVRCNLATGGAVEQVKGVNSSVTYKPLSTARFISNMSLSPYGNMIQELSTLGYFTAGELLAGVCC